MTPERMRECLSLLRWSQRGLADALDMDERQVRRWAAGAAVPAAVAAWLDRLASYHAKHPPPGR
jgi:ribosome-binding protein aMBF1 (putative translation factor)